MARTLILAGGAVVVFSTLVLLTGVTAPGLSQTNVAPDETNSQESAAPPPSPQRDAYLKALDGLSDEQAEMVPVVLATVGELACDGLEVDRKKTAGFVAAHAGADSREARNQAAETARSATSALLGPWLAYVHQDSAAFCQQAYALKQSGQDLWKN